MRIGPYTLECNGFYQDSNDNYDSDYAVLNVWEHGKLQFQMTPERRLYKASGQPQTMVAIHSVPAWDLYVVYEGANPSTGQPIIKAILNPLVGWVWGGWMVMVLGTFIALTPSVGPFKAAVSVMAARPVLPEAVLKGGD
jgi:cytochrome c-type biogenesis protein CcmF